MRSPWRRGYASFMTTYLGRVVPGGGRVHGQGLDLSRDARRRLGWFDFYEAHGRNARLTCRHFGIAPQTFYRWKRRFDPRALESLEAHSSRPGRVRQPTWDLPLERAVLELRRTYPRWGRAKLMVLLGRQGRRVSQSMVGRILDKLRRTHQLVETVRGRRSRRGRKWFRRWAVRKPREYVVKEPGDLVEVDTADIRIVPGAVFKHFGARDLVSRWDVVDVHNRATAASAALFLDAMEERCPFPIRAIQVDGGSEFKADFEEACRQRGIRLFVLPPKSPKLNGHVERSNRTHREEFYELCALETTAGELRESVRRWEQIYNTVRPHQSLGYLTPAEYIARWRASDNATGDLGQAQRGRRGGAGPAGHEEPAPRHPQHGGLAHLPREPPSPAVAVPRARRLTANSTARRRKPSPTY